jgi:CheY-like chemotaxis protein
MGDFLSCCIIDDDDFFAFNTKRLMKKVGFCQNILHYENGQDAIDGLIGLMVEDLPLPEIVLLDINMPKKNGWEFLKEFKELPDTKRKNTSVYLVSSFISPTNITKAKEYEDIVEDYIVKPISEETLIELTSSKKGD